MTKLIVGRDEHSSLSYSRELSESVKTIALPALGAASFVVPADIRTLLISYSPGASVAVGKNVVPASPSGAFSDQPSTDLVPTLINVVPGDTINFKEIGTDPALVWVSLYNV